MTSYFQHLNSLKLVIICEDLRDLVPLERNFKNVKNIHGSLILSVMLQALVNNFTISISRTLLFHGYFSRFF